MAWAPPSLSVQAKNQFIIHSVLIVGWPGAPGGDIPGLPEMAACAVLGEFKDESGFDPDAVGDHGNADGEGQWWPLRRQAIYEGCGIDIGLTPGLPLPDMATQARAALWELWHPERPALEAILAAKTPYDAGVAATERWMRPKKPDNAHQRGLDTETIYMGFVKEDGQPAPVAP